MCVCVCVCVCVRVCGCLHACVSIQWETWPECMCPYQLILSYTYMVLRGGRKATTRKSRGVNASRIFSLLLRIGHC